MKISKKANKNVLTGLDTSFELEEIKLSNKCENIEIIVKHIEYDLQGNPYKAELSKSINLSNFNNNMPPHIPMINSENLSEDKINNNKIILEELKSNIVKLVEKSFLKLNFE